MCDFAVVAAIKNVANLLVIELKSGVAYPDEVENYPKASERFTTTLKKTAYIPSRRHTW